MRAELISITTPTQSLDAGYYTPEGAIQGAATYGHGNQLNFYVCAARFLASHITSLGYAVSSECVGGAYQTVAEGIADNELAAEYLADKGIKKPIVIGHSNGKVLASEHGANHPETKALIL